jgi:DNA-binding CsgD family transcriptional regulator
MNLGVVGEKLLKYIFGIYLLELNNKQIMSKTPEEFDELFRASNKRIKEIANILKLNTNSC